MDGRELIGSDAEKNEERDSLNAEEACNESSIAAKKPERKIPSDGRKVSKQKQGSLVERDVGEELEALEEDRASNGMILSKNNSKLRFSLISSLRKIDD